MTSEQKLLIDMVLDGTIESLHCYDNPLIPHQVEKYLKSKGWERTELDSNGWQWDFWVTFTKDGKEFVLSGSGYYGQTVFAEKEE